MNISVQSPAKINLHLSVFEKQPDGYHRVETTMLKVGLFDSIHIKILDGEGIEVTVDEPFAFLSGEKNLAYKAADLFLQATGLKKKIQIHIQKNIPLGAGLGGGSGNAGVVLNHLNECLGRPLIENQLMELGRKLGADVPFFVQPLDFAFLVGRGDAVLESSQFPSLSLLIVYPNLQVSTPDVYHRLGRSLTWEGSGGISGACDRKITAWKDVDFLLKKGNDLQPVTEAMHPQIGNVRGMLQEHGAYFSQMSGSGASIFGLFEDEERAKEAESSLKKAGQCFLVRSGTSF